MDPSKIIDTLKKYILVDGFHIVVDTKKSHGSWIRDAVTGKEYLDCASNFSSSPLAWNHPKLIAQKDRLADASLYKIANPDFYTEEYANFVESIASITPEFKHYFFIDGGALAVTNSIKIAWDYQMQKMGYKEDKFEDLTLISLKEAFHGRDGITMSITDTSEDKTRFFPKFRWNKVLNPKVVYPVNDQEQSIREVRSLHEMAKLLENGNVAAIILEPLQGEGGNNVFRKEYLSEVRRLATLYDTLLIFDEVQTCLATGYFFAYQKYEVVPDMVCLGKRTQIAGVLSTSKVDDVPKNAFNVSSRINSTFGGDYTSMVRFSIMLQIIKEDNLIEHSRHVGDYFVEQLWQVERLLQPRGFGSLIAFDLESIEIRDRFISLLKEDMLVLKCGTRSIRFRPNLNFSKEDVDVAITYIKKVLNKF